MKVVLENEISYLLIECIAQSSVDSQLGYSRIERFKSAKGPLCHHAIWVVMKFEQRAHGWNE
jgi:hypothetical protein